MIPFSVPFRTPFLLCNESNDFVYVGKTDDGLHCIFFFFFVSFPLILLSHTRNLFHSVLFYYMGWCFIPFFSSYFGPAAHKLYTFCFSFYTGIPLYKSRTPVHCPELVADICTFVVESCDSCSCDTDLGPQPQKKRGKGYLRRVIICDWPAVRGNPGHWPLYLSAEYLSHVQFGSQSRCKTRSISAVFRAPSSIWENR